VFPRDRWPTILGIFGAVIALLGLGLSGSVQDAGWSERSLLGIDLGSWGIAISVLALFLILQITLNARTALTRERRLVEVAAELRESGVELERLATVDPLIGVLNRRAFFERLEAEVRRSLRYGHHLSALMIDLDHFKELNDRYGHAAGDRVLVEIGRCIVNNLRGSDVVGRYGGEELAVFLPETAPADGRLVAEKLRAEIEGLSIKADIDGSSNTASMRATISVGVATLPDLSITDGQDLIRFADKALYIAKREGRNRVSVALQTARPR
jgi:diguanylate cyclase (GGDEF)-like protein